MCNNKAESPRHHHTWSFCCGTFFQYRDNQFNYVCTWSWQPIFLCHDFQPVQLLSLQAQGNSHFLSHFEILPCPKVMISFSNCATSRHKAKKMKVLSKLCSPNCYQIPMSKNFTTVTLILLWYLTNQVNSRSSSKPPTSNFPSSTGYSKERS